MVPVGVFLDALGRACELGGLPDFHTLRAVGPQTWRISVEPRDLTSWASYFDRRPAETESTRVIDGTVQRTRRKLVVSHLAGCIVEIDDAPLPPRTGGGDGR